MRRAFPHHEGAAMSAFGLYLTVTMLFLAGIAIDVVHVRAARVQLQVAADSAAHAALLVRKRDGEAAARARALHLAEANMPAEVCGTVLTGAQSEFGRWNEDALRFEPKPGCRDAAIRTCLTM